MSRVRYITIDENSIDQRIDNFLMRELNKVPRSVIYRILRKGEVRVNKKRIKQTYRLQLGDIVRIPPVEVAAKTVITPVKAKFEWLEQQVLYEDVGMLVLNKPAGLAVHGGSGINCGLIEALRVVREDKNLELVHRLDRGTSGCIMIAKKRSVLRELHAALRDHQIAKTYQAIVLGNWSASCNKIDVPLKKNVLQSGERIVRVDPDGKEAITTFKILKRFSAFTLIEARLKTGRTHQIRVHTKHAGHSIIGDDKYTNNKINLEFAKKYGLKRMCLHAVSLKLLPPGADEMLEVRAPIAWGV